MSTNEGLYPVSGVKDLTLDVSVARGVTELDNAINLAITPGSGNAVSVFGYSQSAIIASEEMPKLLAEGFTNGTGGRRTRFTSPSSVMSTTPTAACFRVSPA